MVTTHKTNTNFSSAELQNRYDRKTRQQAEAERIEKAASDTKKALSRNKGLKTAALLEKKSRMNANSQVNKVGAIYSAAATSNLPPLLLKQREASNAKNDAPKRKKKKIQKTITIEVSASEDEDGPESLLEEAMDVDTPLQVQSTQDGDLSGSSGEEYIPSNNAKGTGSEESSDGDDVELEDEELDTILDKKQRKQDKKQKKGIVAHSRVKALRDRLLDASDTALGSTLLVNSAKKSHSKSSKSKSSKSSEKHTNPTHLTGVKASWNEDEDVYHPGKDQAQSWMNRGERKREQKYEKQINQAILSKWKNQLACAATAALESEFDIRSLESTEERATFVNLFLGRMVMRVLAEHFAFVSNVPEDALVPSQKPQGALMMAILAVLWALEYLHSSVLKVPKGRIGFFSQKNWGDYESTNIIDGATKCVHVWQSTVFKLKIESLTNEHWAKIVETTKSYLGKRKDNFLGRSKVGEHPEVVAVDEESDLDGDLFDPMFDKPSTSTQLESSAPAGHVST
ncbi:hypothetical protein EST38_g12943 [Candolleomyces aberdarensis]|uniref:Uncharacterized protein n=1 Tax=Candolleomyces aberdarensis TaxID=2316362 RepID=A0A4Q2D2C1_9AGAR|nr:hypothetical protein EST38_g12943 [Candolleomyces aberdarensis]